MMTRSKFMLNSAASLAALVIGCWSPVAMAQAADPATDTEVPPEDIITITVTGSRLLTAVQAEALPLRILTTDDLKKQGNPPLVDILRAQPEAMGSAGPSASASARPSEVRLTPPQRPAAGAVLTIFFN